MARKGRILYRYHGFGEAPTGAVDRFLFLSAAEFRRQLNCLMRMPAAPVGALSDPDILLTIDDGLTSVYDVALPILQEYKIKAMLYLVAGQLGGKNEWDARHGYASLSLMNVEQIREWLRCGQLIGSHGLAHRNLTKLSPAELQRDLRESKSVLEDTFGVEVSDFCYPHGQWNRAVREQVEMAGYRTAVTTEFGVNRPAADRLALKRIEALPALLLLRKAADRFQKRLFRR